MRIAIVTPIPTPYRDPFWVAVSSLPGVALKVFYCSAGKQDRPWHTDWSQRFDYEVLPGWNLTRSLGSDSSCYWNPEIVRKLRAGKFDVLILGGYNHPTMWSAMRYALKQEIPFYLMTESHLQLQRSVWKRCLKLLPVRWVTAQAAGGFPTGILAKQYLLHYGAHPQNLVCIPNVPDVIDLHARARELRPHADQLRREHGIDQRPTILFVGRLIPKKRVELLLRAFAPYACESQLAIVGTGSELSRLQQLTQQLGISHAVSFAGFVQPRQLPKWYAMADLFVMPSSETWGVSVIEALASNLPVVVTNEVGCHQDVVSSSAVGSVIPPANLDALTSALGEWLNRNWEELGVANVWQPIRDSLGYETLAQRIINHLRATPESLQEVA